MHACPSRQTTGTNVSALRVLVCFIAQGSATSRSLASQRLVGNSVASR